VDLASSPRSKGEGGGGIYIMCRMEVAIFSPIRPY